MALHHLRLVDQFRVDIIDFLYKVHNDMHLHANTIHSSKICLSINHWVSAPSFVMGSRNRDHTFIFFSTYFYLLVACPSSSLGALPWIIGAAAVIGGILLLGVIALIVAKIILMLIVSIVDTCM